LGVYSLKHLQFKLSLLTISYRYFCVFLEFASRASRAACDNFSLEPPFFVAQAGLLAAKISLVRVSPVLLHADRVIELAYFLEAT
jgi:hypothetical protein